MRLFLIIAGVLGAWGTVAGLGCSQSPKQPGEPLYFALEVRQQGKLVAKPKLLGHSGVRLQAERRQPGATEPDYSLSLDPSTSGDSFQVGLDLKLKETVGHSEVALKHGQERTVQLGAKPGDLEISLMVMRVDSPEFRALIALADDHADAQGGADPI
jgi:hypothetical protein